MSGHGGNLRQLAQRAGRRAEDILDFSANIDPLGPPECIRPAISRAVEQLVNYPDPDSADLVAAISRRYGLPAENIVVGNGSTELLHCLMRAVAATAESQPRAAVPHAESQPRAAVPHAESQPRAAVPRAVVPVPSYVDYVDAARLAGLDVETVALDEADGFAVNWPALAGRFRDSDLAVLGQPNNPTGLLFDQAEFLRFAAAHPTVLFAVDEAFADFVPDYRTIARDVPDNVIVLHSLTKFYGIPGLRLGFAAAQPELADRLRRQLPPWSVNGLAQAVGVAALADEDYARRTVAYVAEQRTWVAGELAELPGLNVYPSVANFLLVRVDRSDIDAHQLAERLLADGIAIRTYDQAQHLDRRFFRVAVRTRADNERLVRAISAAMGRPRPAPARRRAAAIMFQGTSSNAGKSVLTAALCRILLQDGVRVAPFKSQNMSLNSFVTRGGGEMGRAQVVQAQACRLEPDVRMNPILLKPNSDTGSQVIVRGTPVGNMRVGEYIRYKPTAFTAAKECYDSLADEFDAIVLEGAGSPGEVNLKAHDIVNMRMAQYAAAPVLIVGDIDRGGVFASFVGTMEVLAPWERAQVAGWIVNRFRGDARLLGDALDYTLAHTGRPVLGVVPYVRDLGLPQEDSVEFKELAGRQQRRTQSNDEHGSSRVASSQDASETASVEISVIDLPHISNFTDFDAFAVEADVRVRIVRSAGELDGPDAVIIPGSKNTLADLDYLRHSGLAAKIASLATAGRTEVIGICGGYQMLGRSIRDPHGIESDRGRATGLGLLEVETVLAADKTLTRTSVRHAPSGCPVHGYEIHHGQTAGDGLVPVLVREDGQAAGVARGDGLVWGTYLHGVFDADGFRRAFIDGLRVRRGLAAVGKVVGCYDIEAALDNLAAAVRKSLKMDEVYRLLKL